MKDMLMSDSYMSKFLSSIVGEYMDAVEKHPKFCDELTGATQEQMGMLEFRIKKVNSKGPYYAEFLLREEFAEAMNAYLKGDKEQCLQELAQCGAVILRMMDFVRCSITKHKEVGMPCGGKKTGGKKPPKK